MKNALKIVVAFIVLAIVAGMMFVVTRSLATPQTAAVVCDIASWKTFAKEAKEQGREMNADLLLQWVLRCEKAQAASPSVSASPSATASPSVSASPSATASASPSSAPSTSTPVAPAASVEEFLANRPVNTKTSTNAFGPTTAVLPSLKNKWMEDLTAEEALAELIYVSVEVDRMHTAHKALGLGIVALNGDENQVNDLTKRFVNDRPYWDQVRKQLEDRMDQLLPAITKKEPGTVVKMSYSTPGDIPQVGRDDVSFSYPTLWLSLYDPVTKELVIEYRLLCHFQFGDDWLQELMTPPEGAAITPEGETIVLVDACRLVDGEWMNMYDVEKLPGDRKVDDVKCTPLATPSTTSTPSMTATPAPSPTSTPEDTPPPPEPTPSTTPTTTSTPTATQSCGVNKECESAPEELDEYSSPAPSPISTRESLAPVEPTRAVPSDEPNDPIVIPAESATPAPEPSAPVPTFEVAPEPSASHTDDTDPGRE